MTRIEINRVDDAYAFEATNTNGHSFLMDAAVGIGGLLPAAGCSIEWEVAVIN